MAARSDRRRFFEGGMKSLSVCSRRPASPRGDPECVPMRNSPHMEYSTNYRDSKAISVRMIKVRRLPPDRAND